jgi:hypothetical protein
MGDKTPFWSRREFLRTTGAAIAAVSLVPGIAKAAG